MKAKIPGILEDLRALKPDEIGKLDLDALAFTGRIINDAKVSDHHAIIPTGKRPGDPVAGGAEGLRRRRHPPDRRLLPGLREGGDDRRRGVERGAVPGQGRAGARAGLDRAVPPQARDDQKEDEQELPEFRPGESGPHEPSVRRGETTPPKPYTEASLLGAMETAGKLVDDEQLKEALKERGLGTPATRAAIIETLLERGYIAREKKALVATDLGPLPRGPGPGPGPEEPGADGRVGGEAPGDRARPAGPATVHGEIVRYTGEVIRSGDGAPIDAGRLGDCPRCGRPVIEGKRGFGCSGWREGCPFVLWREYQGRSLGDDQIRELLQRRRPARGPSAGRERARWSST